MPTSATLPAMRSAELAPPVLALVRGAGRCATGAGASTTRRSTPPLPPPGPAPAGAAWLPVAGGRRSAGWVWALVDADRVPALAGYRWRLRGAYPVRPAPRNPHRLAALHHDVLPARPGVYVDHANGDPLDARRANLRYATNSLNQANRRPVRSGSGWKGVTRHAGARRWQAAVKCQGRNYHLGLYADPGDAARAYWHAARALFGPYAWTNLPEPLRALGDDAVSAAIRRRVAGVGRTAARAGTVTGDAFAAAAEPTPHAAEAAPAPAAGVAATLPRAA